MAMLNRNSAGSVSTLIALLRLENVFKKLKKILASSPKPLAQKGLHLHSIFVDVGVHPTPETRPIQLALRHVAN